jgi:hypothetical protein
MYNLQLLLNVGLGRKLLLVGGRQVNGVLVAQDPSTSLPDQRCCDTVRETPLTITATALSWKTEWWRQSSRE